MNNAVRNYAGYAKTVTVAAVVSIALAGCASAPLSPNGAAEVRSKLTRLQSDPNLAGRAPVALEETEEQARATDRGLVLTLGDVLFTSGQADLKIGSDDYNQGLS